MTLWKEKKSEGVFPAIWKFYNTGIYSEHKIKCKTTNCKCVILSTYTMYSKQILGLKLSDRQVKCIKIQIQCKK